MPEIPELIVALDVPNSAAITPLIEQLPPEIRMFKIGLELFTSEGPAALTPLLNAGKLVFLDLKLHDIPRTVARAVTSASQLGVSLLTVHASGGRGMLEAAAEAARTAGDRAPRLVAVTTLTSLSQADIEEMGVSRPLPEHTASLGAMAVAAGVDGLVCSPLEVGRFRQTLGPRALLVTPGIRPAGADMGDQKRVATPAAAVKAGASYLVVGRPILGAPDPHAAAVEILSQMSKA